MTDPGTPGAAGPPGRDPLAGEPDTPASGDRAGAAHPPGRHRGDAEPPEPPEPPDVEDYPYIPADLADAAMPMAPGSVPRGARTWAGMLRRAEQSAVHRAESVRVPAWLRRTPGEKRWPVTLTIVVAIVLQLVLPGRLVLHPIPIWLLPSLEGALLVGLIVANPVRIERRTQVIAVASIVLTLLITFANAASAVLLIREILNGITKHAVPLLTSGAAIWLTNVIAFALWYWEFDRGGPVNRAQGLARYPDLMFPQMASPQLAPPDWEPWFLDYLYLSFTNATAFSPTDVMPLVRWAKMTMLVQSAVSLALVVLVVARAVNILA